MNNMNSQIDYAGASGGSDQPQPSTSKPIGIVAPIPKQPPRPTTPSESSEDEDDGLTMTWNEARQIITEREREEADRRRMLQQIEIERRMELEWAERRRREAQAHFPRQTVIHHTDQLSEDESESEAPAEKEEAIYSPFAPSFVAFRTDPETQEEIEVAQYFPTGPANFVTSLPQNSDAEFENPRDPEPAQYFSPGPLANFVTMQSFPENARVWGTQFQVGIGIPGDAEPEPVQYFSPGPQIPNFVAIHSMPPPTIVIPEPQFQIPGNGEPAQGLLAIASGNSDTVTDVDELPMPVVNPILQSHLNQLFLEQYNQPTGVENIVANMQKRLRDSLQQQTSYKEEEGNHELAQHQNFN